MATPRERRHEKTRYAILRAARTLIRRHGADNLTMRQIAEEIDYSAAGLYEYFGGKDAIVAALCQESDRRLREYLLDIEPDASPSERLIQSGLGYIRFAMDYPEEFMLLMGSKQSGRGSLDDPVAGESSYAVLVQLVQEAGDAGAIDVSWAGVEGVAYSCWAFVHGMATLRLTHLQNFEAEFDPIHRWALEKFVEGMRT